MEIKVL
jgi:hypothetical protein